MPIANWFKINETGDIGYLLKCNFFECENKAKELTLDQAKYLIGIFSEMPYQFDRIDSEVIDVERQIWINFMKYVQTEQPQYKNQANILTAQKNKMIKELSSGKTMTLVEQTAALNVNLKLNIDIYTCSTAMWFAYRTMFIEQSKSVKYDKNME